MTTNLEVRELYAPGHFGNQYEAVLPNEMTEILSEAKFWGFNRYTDWFDPHDLYNPYTKKHDLCKFNMPEAVWAKKFANYQIAAKLGLPIGLLVTPNHVFSNEITPENQADKNRIIEGQLNPPYGQLVCPSKPGVTEMILDYYTHLFEDFKKHGLRLSSLTGGSYDFGGCACDECQPWIVAFGKLFKRICELADRYFGKVQANVLAWWWSDLDHRYFTEWANREARGFFTGMVNFLPYNESRYAVRPSPEGCGELAFTHISYGENIIIDDTYGHYGPTIAPDRLEKTVRYLFERKARGFSAYSEGAFEDVNKALIAGLGSGQFQTAGEVLAAYAKRYLGGSVEGWVEWLNLMSDASKIDLPKAATLFDKLSPESNSCWRVDQLHQRLKMFQADADVRARKEWDAERIQAADAFFAAKEHLYRKCWGLGLTRTIFDIYGNVPDWFKEYQSIKCIHQQAGALSDEAVRCR